MLTSPQRMLLEMDERLREKQRAALGDENSMAAYYADVARRGDSETIRNLAILGDPAAQKVFEPTTHPEFWSVQTRIEQDVHNSRSRNLAIMIVDELVDRYEEILNELIGNRNDGIDPANPVFFAHHRQGLELIKNYYDRYNSLRFNSGTGSNFSNLEYELGGETNQRGRLVAISSGIITSIIGIIGLACLIRTTGFSAPEPLDLAIGVGGMSRYLGNALGRAQQDKIPTTEILERLRERLQSQLF